MTDDELAAIEHTPDVAALVAEVRRLKSELAHAGRPRYSGDASVMVDAIDAAFNRGVEAMSSQVARLTVERDEARAVINGRNTAPTDEEIAAHAHPLRSPIGAWLITATDGPRQLVHLWRPFDGDSRSEDWEKLRRRMGPFKFTIARWVPIDAEGRPCAWPVVP